MCSLNYPLEIYFKKIHDGILMTANKELKELDLTFSQMEVLICLLENQGITQKNIEVYFKLSHPTVTGILQRLEIKGLISTRKNEGDKRSKIILVTDKALNIKKEIDRKKECLEKRLSENMTNEELQTLTNLLKTICENLCKE